MNLLSHKKKKIWKISNKPKKMRWKNKQVSLDNLYINVIFFQTFIHTTIITIVEKN